MLIEVPNKFLEKRTGALYERVFVNTNNISCLNANGYNYGKGLEYNVSMQLTNGNFIPFCYLVDEKMVYDIVEWFNKEIEQEKQ